MASRIIVVGGGGFGREVMCWAGDCARAGTMPELAGFIDDKPMALDGYAPRLGSIQDFMPAADDLLVLAVARPVIKQMLSGLLKDRGAHFAQLFHPTATVARTAKPGEGLVMCPHSGLTADTATGAFVTILNYSGLGHDAVAGDFCTISSYCDVMGNARLGDGVFLGSGARILPGVSVGRGALVGAGAVVIRTVKPGTTIYAPLSKTMRSINGVKDAREKDIEDNG